MSQERGGSPLRKAAKKLPASTHAEKTKKTARKRQAVDDPDPDQGKQANWSWKKCGKHDFLCLICDEMHPYLRSDRVQPCYADEKKRPVSLESLKLSENCMAFFRQRFGHRSLTFCGTCGNNEVKPFLEAVNASEPTAEGLELVHSIEAHFDRTCGTGQAIDSRGYFHEQLFIRRTCQALFDLDATSKRLAASLATASESELAAGIGEMFSAADFNTKNSQVRDEGPDDGACAWADLPPVDGIRTHAEYFKSFPNVGPFKCMFCLYFMAQLTESRSTQLQCEDELDRFFIADWGVGKALKHLCGSVNVPMKQADSLSTGRRTSIFTIMLFYSKLGIMIRDIGTRYGRPLRIKFTLLHLEFLLCEVRKVRDTRAARYRKASLLDPKLEELRRRVVVQADW